MLKKLAYPLIALALAGCSNPCSDSTTKDAINDIVQTNRGLLGTFWFLTEKDEVSTALSGIETLKESKDSATCTAMLTAQNKKNGEIVQKPIKYIRSTLPDGRSYVNVYGLGN